jgi:hypothetical protein
MSRTIRPQRYSDGLSLTEHAAIDHGNAPYVESFAGSDIHAKWATAIAAVESGAIGPSLQFESGAEHTISSSLVFDANLKLHLDLNFAKLKAGANDIVIIKASATNETTFLGGIGICRGNFDINGKTGVTGIQLGEAWRVSGMPNSKTISRAMLRDLQIVDSTSAGGGPGYDLSDPAKRTVGIDLRCAQFCYFQNVEIKTLDVGLWTRNDVYTSNPAPTGGNSSNHFQDFKITLCTVGVLHQQNSEFDSYDTLLENVQVLNNFISDFAFIGIAGPGQYNVTVSGSAPESIQIATRYAADKNQTFTVDYKDGASGSVTIPIAPIYMENVTRGLLKRVSAVYAIPFLRLKGNTDLVLDEGYANWIRLDDDRPRVRIGSGQYWYGYAQSVVEYGKPKFTPFFEANGSELSGLAYRGVSIAAKGATTTDANDSSNLHNSAYWNGTDGEGVPQFRAGGIIGSVTNDGVVTDSLHGKIRKVTFPTSAGSATTNAIGWDWQTDGQPLCNGFTDENVFSLVAMKLVNYSNERAEIEFAVCTNTAYSTADRRGPECRFTAVIPAANAANEEPWRYLVIFAAPGHISQAKMWKVEATSGAIQIGINEFYVNKCATSSETAVNALKSRMANLRFSSS